jgi:hypothetical protein
MRFMQGANYELMMNVIGVLNVISIALQAVYTTVRAHRIWIIVESSLNFVFLFEMMADMYIQGSIKRAYERKFRLWPETLCQIINIFATVIFWMNYNNSLRFAQIITYFEIIIFIRILKIMTLLYESDTMRVIFETMRNLITPLTSLIVVVLLIMYEFAVIGMFLFGGIIQTNSIAIL